MKVNGGYSCRWTINLMFRFEDFSFRNATPTLCAPIWRRSSLPQASARAKSSASCHSFLLPLWKHRRVPAVQAKQTLDVWLVCCTRKLWKTQLCFFYLSKNSAKQLKARNCTIPNHHHLRGRTCRKCQILTHYLPVEKNIIHFFIFKHILLLSVFISGLQAFSLLGDNNHSKLRETQCLWELKILKSST